MNKEFIVIVLLVLCLLDIFRLNHVLHFDSNYQSYVLL